MSMLAAMPDEMDSGSGGGFDDEMESGMRAPPRFARPGDDGRRDKCCRVPCAA